MGSFAEERLQQLREKQIDQRGKTRKEKEAVGSSGTGGTLSFAEERLQQLNQRKVKSAPVGNDKLVAGFVDYVKKAEKAKERIQSTQSSRKEEVQSAASKPQATLRNLINTSGFTDEELQESERKKALYTPQGFESLRGASDYAELSEKGKKLKHGLSDQAYVGNETGYFLKSYNTYYLTPEERKLHNYILAKEGEEGAKAYLDSMSETMNERASGKWKEAAQNIGEEMPGRATVYDSFLSTAAAPTGILYALAQNAVGNDVDVNSPYLMGSQLEGDVREGIKENKIPMVSKGTSDFLVDTGLSMAQNVARMPMGAAGLVLAGGGAATGGYLDAKDRGASEGQALAEGAAQGVAEAFFEKFSLEGVQALKAGSVRSARDLFKNMAKQAFTEGTEEMFTEIANDWSDRAIMGELSNYQSTLNGYLNQGMSESEAKVQAFLDMVKNVALAGAGGALSGGIMGGGAQALGTYLNGRNSTIEDYQEYADSVETDEAAYENHEDYETAQTMRGLALEMVEKQQEGKKLTTMEKGYFENAVNDLAAQVEDRAQIEAQEGEEDTQTNVSSPTQEKANSVAHSEPREHNFDDLAEEFGKNGQAAISEMYDESMDTVGYFKAFSRYYNAGRYNIDMSEADSHASAALLTQEQAKKAFKAGAQDRNAEIGYDPATGEMKGMQQGEAKTGGLEYAVPSATDAQKKVADVLGKRTGLKFEIVDDSGDGTAIASYSPGVVKISANAKNFNAAVSHELTHFIKDYSADMYQLYEDTAVKAITRAEGVDIESMLDRYISRYAEAGQQITRTQAMEEIVADATEKFFNDPEYIDSLVKENRTLGEKILDFIEDMIDAIKSLIQTGSKRQAAKALEQNLEMYERARTYWMQGLQEAGDRYKEGWEKTGKGEKYQLKDPDKVTEAQIEKNYDIVRNMKPVITLQGDEFTRRDIKISEQIMDFYNSLGNVVHNEVVGDILLNKRSAKDDIAHGVGRLKSITFKSVPFVLEKGKVLQYQKNWKGRSYDTATIGARVDVAGGDQSGEYYVVCIVKVDETNRMYLHEVHARKMDAPSPFWTGGDQKIVLPGEDAHPFVNSIVDNGRGVNNQQEVQVTKMDGSIPFKTWTVENGLPSGHTPSIYSIFDKLQNVNQKTAEPQKLQLKDSLEGDQNTKGNEKEAVNSAEGIRFQLEDVDDYQAAITDLIHENDELKEANEHLKRQFKLTSKEALRQEDVRKVAGDILERYGSKYKKETLVNNLTKIYEYIRSADVDQTELSQVAGDLGRSILKNSTQVDNALAEQYKDTRKKIRDTKIAISDQDKTDLAAVGGYNNFRKKYFGRMKLGNDGISVDSLYEELAGEVPEMFDLEITHPADRLQQIGNFLDITQPQVSNPYHANMDEMSYLVGQEILSAYTEIRNPPATMADRYEAKYQKARDDYRKKIQAFKDKTIAEYEEVLAEKDKEISKLETDYSIDMAVQQLKYRKKMDERRNRERKWKAKKSIMKNAKELQKWLLSPTDSKHVPQTMRTAIADMLSTIDVSPTYPKAEREIRWNRAKTSFERIIAAGNIVVDDDGAIHYMEIDPDMMARISDFVNGERTEKTISKTDLEEMGTKLHKMEKLDDLETGELEELQKMVAAIKKAVQGVGKQKWNVRYENDAQLAEDVFKDLDKRKQHKALVGKLDDLAALPNYDMLDPQTMFGKISPAFKTTYDSLRKGLDKKTVCIQKAKEYFDKSLEDAEVNVQDVRKWGNEKAKTFETVGGEISLSIPQIMSLYELNKRGQGRKHIYDKNGGIKPSDRNGLIKVDSPEGVTRVTKDDVDKICNTLTPAQKKLADAIQKFIQDEIAAWGNEVSMELYDYEKFTANDYFPIMSDGSRMYREESSKAGKSPTIKNIGQTKSTNEYANNAIIIDDIFDIFTRQVDQMSSYAGFVIPLTDLHQVMEYKQATDGGKSMKEQLKRAFGERSIEYVDKLVQDINGSVYTERASISSKLMSNMKAASVSGNLRVAIQQPTSIARALAEIDPKYIAKGVASMEKNRWEKITKYAPIAAWKDWGFYQMQTSRAMKDVILGSSSKKQALVDFCMKAAEGGDKFTWNRLWSACEAETLDKYPELKKGSEEFYQKVGERFSKIVDKTQVVDSVLHRTQIMRSKNDLTKMVTSFLGEPMKSYNMLYRAAYDARMNRKGSKGKLARSVATYLANGFLTATAAALIDAFRDKDRDKTFGQKYVDAFAGNLKDNWMTLNSLPYIKDIISIAEGYTVSRTDMSGFQDIYYAYKKVESWSEGKNGYTPQYIFIQSAQALSKVLGLPIESVIRDSAAILDTVINHCIDGKTDYKWLQQTYDIKHKRNLGTYVAMIIREEGKGNTELALQIYNDLIACGFDNGQIDNKIKELLREVVKEDPLIQDLVDAKLASDTKEADKLYSELINMGYSPKLIASVVKTETSKEEDDGSDLTYDKITSLDSIMNEESTLYNNGDMIRALEAGKTDDLDRIIKEIYESKKNASKEKETKKKESAARSAIKSALTAEYKPLYIQGTAEEKREIRKKLTSIRVGGKALYEYDSFENWKEDK